MNEISKSICSKLKKKGTLFHPDFTTISPFSGLSIVKISSRRLLPYYLSFTPLPMDTPVAKRTDTDQDSEKHL